MDGSLRVRLVGLAVGLAVAGACTSRSGRAAPSSGGPATTSPSLDPRVIAVIAVGSAPTGIAYGFDRVWVSNHHSNSVSVIDPSTNQVTDEIPFAAQPLGITIGDGYVWVATTKADGTIVRIDPKTLALTEFVPGDSDISCPPAVAYGYIYASQPGFDPGTAFISKSSETTHKRVAKIDVGEGFPCGIVGAEGSIWAAVTAGTRHELWQIEKSSAEVLAKIQMPCGLSVWLWPQSYTFGSLWVATMPQGGSTVCRVDPKTGEVIESIPAGGGVLASGAGGVWIADSSGQRLVRIDPQTNKTDLRIDLPIGEGHMWVEGSDIWYASFSTNEVWRIRP
jgi:YVTN family beta-propeller protein